MCIFGLSVNKNPVEKTPQTLDCGEDTSFQSGGIIRLEIKCTVIVLHLNYPETTPYSLVYEKLSSTIPVSGAEKVGDFCYRCSFRYKGKYCLKCLATLKQSVSSVTQSYPTLWDPMNRSMPGLPVHHLLLEFTRTHVLLSRWCHPTISSSVIPFSSCPQSFPGSGYFPMSQLSTSGGQSIGVSASTSVLPMNTQDWSALGCTGWISVQSKGLSRVFSNTTVQKHQFFGAQLSL